jgi:hypothetical protein
MITDFQRPNPARWQGTAVRSKAALRFADHYCRAESGILGRRSANRKLSKNGLEEINRNLPQADFWGVSEISFVRFRLVARNNFRVARHPPAGKPVRRTLDFATRRDGSDSLFGQLSKFRLQSQRPRLRAPNPHSRKSVLSTRGYLRCSCFNSSNQWSTILIWVPGALSLASRATTKRPSGATS